MDSIKIRITEDGDIVVETDEVSAGNHMNAEQFLRNLEEQMGNKGQRQRLPQSHVHTHEHQHA